MKNAKCVSFGVFVVSDLVVENPQSLMVNFYEAAVEIWRLKCRWHDAFPARKRLCSKCGPRDVQLNQSSHVIFVLMCVVFTFSWKTNVECFVLMHEYSTVMCMLAWFQFMAENLMPTFWEKNFFSETIWLVRVYIFTATLSTDHNELRKAEK